MSYNKLKYVLFFLVIFSCVSDNQRNTQDVSVDIDKILYELPIKEKIAFLGGTNGFYIPGIPGFGLPPIKMADGPLGVRGADSATAFPATLMLASSWNRDLALQMGDAIGKECYFNEVGVLLAPGVNLYRIPQNGRNFEYLGEDPYLASEMVVPYIKGVQQNKVIATVKHFICNNQEFERNRNNVIIDERTLHENYLPPFKAAIEKANVGAIMTAYNMVNNFHCSENKQLLQDIVKTEYNFEGFIMSDWNSVYSPYAAVAGLDLEMPFARYMNYEYLSPLIADFKLSITNIDEKVKRIISTCQKFGLYDEREDISVDWELHNQLAYQIAAEGIVLLKNNENRLPLTNKNTKNIAVFGYNAFYTSVSGGGAAFIKKDNVSNIYQNLKSVGQNAGVQVDAYKTFTDVSKIFNQSEFWLNTSEKGVTVKFFNKGNFNNKPLIENTQNNIYHHFDLNHPPSDSLSKGNYWVEFNSYIKVDKSGKYKLHLKTNNPGTVYLNNKIVMLSYKHTPEQHITETIDLKAGLLYKLRIVQQGMKNGDLKFGYEYINDQFIKQQTSKAADYDAVIVCLGFNESIEGEGHDRPFNLPKEQIKLLQDLYAVNDNIIILLNAGGGVDMTELNKYSSSILHLFYTGQNGNKAAADIIFGNINPSGKLPFTIEKKWQDSPAYFSYDTSFATLYSPIEYNLEGKEHPISDVVYSEGIYTGYKHFDQNNIDPMYCFGYGLSYTTFNYSNLKLSKKIISKDQYITVSADITNIGKVAGKEVVQLYIRDIRSNLERPIKELKGFEKIELLPGETKTVSFTIESDLLEYYNPEKEKWIFEAGEFMVLLGGSVLDVKLTEKFNIE